MNHSLDGNKTSPGLPRRRSFLSNIFHISRGQPSEVERNVQQQGQTSIISEIGTTVVEITSKPQDSGSDAGPPSTTASVPILPPFQFAANVDDFSNDVIQELPPLQYNVRSSPHEFWCSSRAGREYRLRSTVDEFFCPERQPSSLPRSDGGHWGAWIRQQDPDFYDLDADTNESAVVFTEDIDAENVDEDLESVQARGEAARLKRKGSGLELAARRLRRSSVADLARVAASVKARM